MALAIIICNAFISAGLPSFTGGYSDWEQVLIAIPPTTRRFFIWWAFALKPYEIK